MVETRNKIFPGEMTKHKKIKSGICSFFYIGLRLNPLQKTLTLTGIDLNISAQIRAVDISSRIGPGYWRNHVWWLNPPSAATMVLESLLPALTSRAESLDGGPQLEM